MKLVVFLGVSLIAVFTIASARSLPVSFVNSDSTFINLNKNYEVVDGPKEFLFPLKPFKDIWGQISSDTKPNGSDLDYMVYGKIYLMKALGIADRSLFSTKDSSKLSENKDTTVVLTRNQVASLNKPPVKEDSHDDEHIHFPAEAKNTKRQYRFKYWNTPRPVNENLSKQHSDVRKIHERSAESLESHSQDHVEDSIDREDALKSSTIHKASITKSADEASTNLDDEALELLDTFGPRTFLPQSTSNDFPNQQITNVSEPNKDSTIYVDDRFLINVPEKTIQCPDGQRKTHHGTCKRIINHSNSPQDSMLNGRITTGASRLINPANASSGNSSHLAAIFRSFVQLEKKLEKVIKTSEIQLSESMQTDDKKEAPTKVEDS